MLLREKFWLWGHPEGRYNHNADNFGCNDVSRMTPMEACCYLGIRNTFMVPVGVDVNRRQYNKSFKTLRQVGWECFDACEKPELIDNIIDILTHLVLVIYIITLNHLKISKKHLYWNYLK